MNMTAENETWDYADPIDEIYAIRRQISEKCGHSIDRLVEMLAGRRAVDEANGIRYVELPIARHAPVVV